MTVSADSGSKPAISCQYFVNRRAAYFDIMQSNVIRHYDIQHWQTSVRRQYRKPRLPQGTPIGTEKLVIATIGNKPTIFGSDRGTTFGCTEYLFLTYVTMYPRLVGVRMSMFESVLGETEINKVCHLELVVAESICTHSRQRQTI